MSKPSPQDLSQLSQDFKFKGADEAPEDEFQYKGVYFNPMDVNRSVMQTQKSIENAAIKKKKPVQNGFRNKLDQFEKQARNDANNKAILLNNDISYDTSMHGKPQLEEQAEKRLNFQNEKTKLHVSDHKQRRTRSISSEDGNGDDSQEIQQSFHNKPMNHSKAVGMSQQVNFSNRSSQFKVGGQCQVGQANRKKRVPGKQANVSPIPAKQRGLTKYPAKKLKTLGENQQDSSQDDLDDDLEDEDVAYTQRFPQQSTSAFVLPNMNLNRSYESSSDQSGANQMQAQVGTTIIKKRNSSQSNESEIEESVPKPKLNTKLYGGFHNQFFEKQKIDSAKEPAQISIAPSVPKPNPELAYSKQKVINNLDVEESVVVVRIEKVNFKPFQTVIAEILHVQKLNKEMVDVDLKKKQIVQAIMKQSYQLQNQLKVGETFLFRFKSAFKHESTPILNVEDYQQIEIPQAAATAQ